MEKQKCINELLQIRTFDENIGSSQQGMGQPQELKVRGSTRTLRRRGRKALKQIDRNSMAQPLLSKRKVCLIEKEQLEVDNMGQGSKRNKTDSPGGGSETQEEGMGTSLIWVPNYQ